LSAAAEKTLASSFERPSRETFRRTNWPSSVRPWDFAAAEMYAVLGETDKAIEWLDHTVRKSDDRAAWLRIDPLLADVRQHPRFKQILNSMEFRRQQRLALPARQS